MRLVATVVVPPALGDRNAKERVLASRQVQSVDEAKGWLRTNRETWRGALEEHELSFEMWVEPARGGGSILCVIHSKVFGTDGAVLTAKDLRAIPPGRRRR